MANSPRALAMLTFIQTETPRLCSSVAFQTGPMDDAAIYEAYIYTCVVEAMEVFQRSWPRVKIDWRVISPPASPNTLVLRKKACSVKAATNKYGYVLLTVNGAAYELHTDVPVEGRSGVLNEIDVVLLQANVCDRIRRGALKAPRPPDVTLLIEAKCYSNSLELGIGRGFLGLRNSEFGGLPSGYLVSTAENERIQAMVGFHSKRDKAFWPRLNDEQERRDFFIQQVAQRLGSMLVTAPKSAKGAKRAGTSDSPYQVPLPGWE